jgi:hypothetical protein
MRSDHDHAYRRSGVLAGRKISIPMSIKIAESDAELARASDVLLELRSAFTKDALISADQSATAIGYRVHTSNRPARFSRRGLRRRTKLAWANISCRRPRDGRAASVDGRGKRMLDWLKAHALALGCRQLQLDSGVQRFGAHRFYLREGFHISSHHFAITDLNARRAPSRRDPRNVMTIRHCPPSDAARLRDHNHMCARR